MTELTHFAAPESGPTLSQRLLAVAIDYAVVRVLMFGVTVVWGLLSALHYVAGDDTTETPLLVVCLWVAVLIGMFVVGPGRHGGSTAGQRMAGIEIQTNDGAPASGAQYAVRHLLLRACPFVLVPVHTLPSQADLYGIAFLAIHYAPVVLRPGSPGLVDLVLGTRLAVIPASRPHPATSP